MATRFGTAVGTAGRLLAAVLAVSATSCDFLAGFGGAPAPAIVGFAGPAAAVAYGRTATLTAVFTGGAGTVDRGIGQVASGVPFQTPPLYADTAFALTVAAPDGLTATAALFVDVADPPAAVVFTVEGAGFAPVLTVAAGAAVEWTLPDGSTSVQPTPTFNFGTIAGRQVALTVTPWSALKRINIGYDGGDGGSYAIEHVADQQVSAVSGLELVAPTLEQWCSSYNRIAALDFSHFVKLDTIECFLSSSLTSVDLTDTPSLKRACFEDCSLASLDLSQSPALEDLRGAVNEYATIGFGSIGAAVWHICVRDNAYLTDADLFADLTQFPAIAELFIWNDRQTGSIRIPSTHPSMGVSLQADDNQYASLDLSGALRNPSATGEVSFRNNALTAVDLAGCSQINVLRLNSNRLPAAAVDALLADLVAAGRDRAATGEGTPLLVDLSGGSNAAPSAAGQAHAQTLADRGWTVVTAAGTYTPAPPPDTGPATITFSTTGDAASLRCDFLAPATAVWHWSNGATTDAVAGAAAAISGLGPGIHEHTLVVSNGSALSRFGAADAGSGHLTAIAGLNGAPLLGILYVFNEGALTTIGRVEGSRIREYHLMGTALDATAMDQVFADAVASGALKGIIYTPNLGTAASAADRATLAGRGWSL
jgi:hypothetical protein